MPFVGLPRLKMVAGRKKVEADIRGVPAHLRKLRHRELLVREHVTDGSLPKGSGPACESHDPVLWFALRERAVCATVPNR